MLKKLINFLPLLPLITLLGLFLRLWGIDHGFPFIFHPDEPTIVRSALGIRFFPNPHHFDWPHLYIYLNYFLYMGFSSLRVLLESLNLKQAIVSVFPILWNDTLIFYLLTRIFTATLGALAVIPIYLAGKNLFDKKVGLFAALTFAIIPFQVWHAHYSLPDTPMVFFLAWGMYFSSKILTTNKWINYLFAGLFIGFAASTKYNGGLAALTVPLAYVLYFISTKEKLKKIFTWNAFTNLFLAGIAAISGFILGTPFSVLDYATFSRTDGPQGAFWQFTNVGSVSFTQHILQFFDVLVNQLPNNFGYTILIGFFLVVGFCVFKKNDYKLWFIVISALYLIYYISGFSKSRAHYFMICYPFVAVAFGFFVVKLLELLKKFKYISRAVVIILFLIPLLLSLEGSLTFANKDTRVILYDWSVANFNKWENVVYDSNEVDSVLKKLPIRKFKQVPLATHGYIILFNNVDYNLSLPFEEKLFIDNTLRRGPKIKVLKF